MVKKLTRAEVLAQIPAARAAGRDAQRQAWWPADVSYERSRDRVIVSFRDGKSLAVPRAGIPELVDASPEQLEHVELAGEGIRWDALDVDVSVPNLISEWLGPHFSTSASGRMGGRSRSRAKAAAARANGAKGGRPPGRK